MAIDHVRFTPQQVHTIETLQHLASLSEEATRQLLITGGLDALRLEAAKVLYTTQPVSISDVADQVGLDRGILIEWFHTHRVAPWVGPDEATAIQQEFDAWLARELSD